MEETIKYLELLRELREIEKELQLVVSKVRELIKIEKELSRGRFKLITTDGKERIISNPGIKGGLIDLLIEGNAFAGLDFEKFWDLPEISVMAMEIFIDEETGKEIGRDLLERAYPLDEIISFTPL